MGIETRTRPGCRGDMRIRERTHMREWLVATVSTAALAAAVSLAGPVRAQQADMQPADASAASAERQVAFDIPSQDLNAALLAFANAAGIQIVYDVTRVQDLRSAAVTGTLTPREALTRLLAGTGLGFRFTDAATVALNQPSEDGATLPPVTAEAQRFTETAWGPVDGYVATRGETATKSDTALIETPQSISVITRDQMDDRATQSLNDTLRYTAGVLAGDTNDLTTESFSIRGFNSPYLSLYRDGTRAMFRAFDSVIEPYGLERVEVLKGPASVLYGQGVPGGVVNVVTKRPTEAAFREGELLAGSHDRYQGALDLGGPLDDDGSIRYRLTALGRDADTQTDYVPDDRVYVAPALSLHSASGDTNVVLLTSYQRDDTSFPDGLPAAGTVLSNPNGEIPVGRFTGEPDWSKFERTSLSAGYDFDHEFSDVFGLHQTLRYTHSEYDRNQIQNRGLDPTLREIDRRARQGSQESDLVNIDTRLEADFGSGMFHHDAIAGVDFGWAQFDTRMSQGNIAPLDLFTPSYGTAVTTLNPVFDDRQRATQVGLYLQDQLKIGENLIFVGGLRHDWARDKLTDHLGGTTTTQTDEATTYRVGVVYTTPLGIAPYASYTQSFVPLSGGTDAQGNPFDPETGEQYEIGVKYQPPGVNSFITLSLFHLARQNVQTPDPNDPANFFVQTGEIVTKGLEVEGVASLTSNLDLIATYSYTDAEVTESNDVDLGRIPTGVPEHMASLWADYTVGEGDLAGLSAGGGVRHVGKSPGDSVNSFFVPSATLVDAALRYEHGDFRLALNVTNLLDKEYVSTCFSDNSCYYGQGRTVIGRLTYSW